MHILVTLVFEQICFWRIWRKLQKLHWAFFVNLGLKMTIEILDPMIIFNVSSCLNSVPKWPKMIFLIRLNVFRRRNMLVMIRKLIGIVYNTSKTTNTKKSLKLHRRLDFGRREMKNLKNFFCDFRSQRVLVVI